MSTTDPTPLDAPLNPSPGEPPAAGLDAEQLRTQQAEAYFQLRRHIYDVWAGYCSACDIPAPCAEHDRWLGRLHDLEAREEELTAEANT